MHVSMHNIKEIQYVDNDESQIKIIRNHDYHDLYIAHTIHLPVSIGVVFDFSDLRKTIILKNPTNIIVAGRDNGTCPIIAVLDAVDKQVILLNAIQLFEIPRLFGDYTMRALDKLNTPFAKKVLNTLRHTILLNTNDALELSFDTVLFSLNKMFKYVYSHTNLFDINAITNVLNKDPNVEQLGKYLNNNNIYAAIMAYNFYNPSYKSLPFEDLFDKDTIQVFDNILFNIDVPNIIKHDHDTVSSDVIDNKIHLPNDITAYILEHDTVADEVRLILERETHATDNEIYKALMNRSFTWAIMFIDDNTKKYILV